MIRLLRKHWLFLIILLFGIFLRSYRALDWFMYSHDQDLAGWIIKDILINRHIRLIGQLTTSPGIFIGPFYYYLQIPFYLLTNLDPAGSLLLPIILGAFAIFSIYWVFSKIFNQKAGILAALFYSLSYYIVFVDREVVPTMPVMLWTIWYFYGLSLVLKGNRGVYILLGFLGGLIWDLNLALIILAPLILVAQIFSRKKINLKYLFLGFLVFIVTLSPYLIFEVRHNFQQTKAIISSIVTPENYIPGTSRGLAKFDRIFQLVYKNTTSLYWDSVINIRSFITFYLLIFSFIFLVAKNKISRHWAILMFLWQALYVIFFSLNSLNPSEYYLNGMNVVWIAVLSAVTLYFLESRRLRPLGMGVILVFVSLNISGFFNRAPNKSGYIEREALVNFIAQDSKEKGYPCVSVSYITTPGNNLGYRYFFWRAGLHVNQPKSLSPVYTIVFPHSKVNRLDKTFGALGLVLPDYGRYTKESVERSCSGKDSNLTDPMFGYTE